MKSDVYHFIYKKKSLLFLLCILQIWLLCGCSVGNSSSANSNPTSSEANSSNSSSESGDKSSSDENAVTAVAPPTAIEDVQMTVINDNPVEASDESELLANTCGDLSVPTYVNKIDDLFFIVDCYHNQIIYHDNLEDPIWQWNVMPGELSMPHTIASDGTVYLVDDTENHRVVVYERYDDKFVITQTFDNIGTRPHFIKYNESDQTFYAWSSITGEMFLFKRKANSSNTAVSADSTSDDTYHPVYLAEVRKINALDGVYVRSFTIDDDQIYFVSGNENSKIIKATLADFSIIEEYAVPSELAGMIQLSKMENMYYLTVSTDVTGNQDYATIVRTNSLEDLIKGIYEDIYEQFIGGGTPYYISGIDGIYYMTEHRIPGHSVWSFNVENDTVVDVTAVY